MILDKETLDVLNAKEISVVQGSHNNIQIILVDKNIRWQINGKAKDICYSFEEIIFYLSDLLITAMDEKQELIHKIEHAIEGVKENDNNT